MKKLLFLVPLLFITSCGLLSSVPVVGPIVANCTAPTVITAVEGITNTVVSILTSSSSTWLAQLEALAKVVGNEVLTCAIDQIKTTVPTVEANPEMMSNADVVAKVTLAKQRIAEWVIKHPYVLKGAK